MLNCKDFGKDTIKDKKFLNLDEKRHKRKENRRHTKTVLQKTMHKTKTKRTLRRH